ncbi:hypothetical protein LTR66_010924 [Elasticomyces elasticus]|nr:hypothetical protein LTR66_010924 [Elasticomyces elasticus]
MILPAAHEIEIQRMLDPSEIFDQSSPNYQRETHCWAAQKDQHPAIVLRPKSLPALQSVLRYLYASDLDFAVRSGGVGSSSARDVVLSMGAFDGFDFDRERATVVLGAGQLWGDVDRKMAALAPGYATVGARYPFVGVGGSILSGGFSWLSHEYGLCSDPKNLLDAQVVLFDGRVVWASQEPELLWALRGGCGNFGGEPFEINSRN